jgi:hypothetical protein
MKLLMGNLKDSPHDAAEKESQRFPPTKLLRGNLKDSPHDAASEESQRFPAMKLRMDIFYFLLHLVA